MAMPLFCSRGERRPKKASLREEVPLHENVFCVPMCVKKNAWKRELILACNSSVEKRFEQRGDEKRTFLITI